ncbi:5540_t:CDS:2 [Paraglomus brasilianum]|uniref:5540_t:CDS:1 n=1 Tax=Paraglomus brasilianum TaxID=144538 RepID=A0A9N9BS43_9GLOM|nr:5540_t:CDS:2 [Paraglomus brasilianum]
MKVVGEWESERRGGSPIVVDKVWRNLHDVLGVEVDCHVLDEEQSRCMKRVFGKVAGIFADGIE